jgi:addiction module HigA family antidote
MDSNQAPETPGHYLQRKYLIPLDLSQNKLARDLDVPPMRINEIIRQRRGITADTALRLARYFDTSPELWLKLQMDYDLFYVRQKSEHKIFQSIRKGTFVKNNVE